MFMYFKQIVKRLDFYSRLTVLFCGHCVPVNFRLFLDLVTAFFFEREETRGEKQKEILVVFLV